MKKINRVYYPYYLWEDYLNGMYKNEIKEEKINDCFALLNNKKHFYEACQLVVSNWKFCVEHNLTNYEINRKAWLGQAACCIRFKASCQTTISAWRLLTTEAQYEANYIAEDTIKRYINNKLNKLCR